MNPVPKTCSDCGVHFQIDDDEQAFLKKVSPKIGGETFEIPHPTQCPPCRAAHRFYFRNRRHLYQITCPVTEKRVLSAIDPESPYIVYDVGYWESDAFDATEYGVDYDFSRPFFEQFQELRLRVPRPNLSVVHTALENADYINGASNVKNAYLSFSMTFVEDIYYSQGIFHAQNIMDCLDTTYSEICYECVDGTNLYNCLWTQDCENSSDLWFSKDCRACNSCFGCTGLRNKKYHIYNQEYSKEDYEQFIANLKLDESSVDAIKSKVKEQWASQPRQHAHLTKVENCTGDYITNSKNCHESFVIEGGEDLRHCYFVQMNAKDTYDLCHFGQNIELVYQCQSVGINASNIIFSIEVYNQVQDVLYSDTCYTSVQNVFGCVGLKRRKYCILNKQYSKEEYEALLPKIIEHMKSTGEWGQFFPKYMSPFSYTYSDATYHFPKTQEEAEKMGYMWKDDLATTPAGPDSIQCEVTGKNFRLIPQELKFYEKFNLPHPKRCPEQRHLDRFAQRTPPKIWSRLCDKCSKETQSSYSPDRPETLYCSQCYLDEMY
jgi:hypothetical protein